MSIAARKIAALVRCIERARDEHSAAAGSFKQDFTRQDAATLNVTRACEASIDLANMLIHKQRLGVPGDGRESFSLLERAGHISPEISGSLRRMIGFRNIAVHQYRELDLDIVESVIKGKLDNSLRFAEVVRGPLTDY